MTAASNDLELVERVFLKIAFAETDDQLQIALNNFLPPALLKFGIPDQQLKDKLIELLSHINKRLRSRPKINLPTQVLIEQYLNKNVSAAVKNFTIIYIKMGYQREANENQLALLPKMFSCMIGQSTQHKIMLLQNVLLHLNEYVYPESDKEKEDFLFVKDIQLKRFLLDYFQDFLLLPYNADEYNDPAKSTPPSHSQTSFERLKMDPVLSKDQIEEIKLGILKFLDNQPFDGHEIIVSFVAALGDTRHRVSDKAEHSIKRLTGPEIWENVEVVSKLLLLYQGTPPQPQNMGVPASSIRTPANIRLKIKIFPFFLKSKLVADCNPAACLQIIFNGLFGKEPVVKIRHYVIDLIQHMCTFSSEKTMAVMSALFYQALSKVALNDKEENKIRSKAFSGFPKLAKRSPETFKKDVALVQKLFTYLEELIKQLESIIKQDSLVELLNK